MIYTLYEILQCGVYSTYKPGHGYMIASFQEEKQIIP